MAQRSLTALTIEEGALDAIRRRVGAMLEGDRDGQGLRVALCCSRFNGAITSRLVEGALAGLRACRVDPRDVSVAWAAGAFELPLVARSFARSGKVDAVACLGAVIRGETGHYEFVAGSSARGIQEVQLQTGVPVAFGVLTTDTVEQAFERSVPGTADTGWEANKGWEAAVTAVEMSRLLHAPALQALAAPCPPGEHPPT